MRLGSLGAELWAIYGLIPGYITTIYLHMVLLATSCNFHKCMASDSNRLMEIIFIRIIGSGKNKECFSVGFFMCYKMAALESMGTEPTELDDAASLKLGEISSNVFFGEGSSSSTLTGCPEIAGAIYSS